MGVARVGLSALIGALATAALATAPAAAAAPCGPPNVLAVIASARPLACWRPYLASSPWNLDVTDAQLDPRSAQLGAAIGTPAHIIAGWEGTSRDYARPVYFSKPGDPIFTP